MRNQVRRKEKGLVGNLLATCICILGMTVMAVAYMSSAGLVFQKAAVGQVARKYILRMETTGGLSQTDRANLLAELKELGVSQISLDGTSTQASYGEPIALHIRGRLENQYVVEEKRVSTSKN
jgi:hypothetical protein